MSKNSEPTVKNSCKINCNLGVAVVVLADSSLRGLNQALHQ